MRGAAFSLHRKKDSSCLKVSTRFMVINEEQMKVWRPDNFVPRYKFGWHFCKSGCILHSYFIDPFTLMSLVQCIRQVYVATTILYIYFNKFYGLFLCDSHECWLRSTNLVWSITDGTSYNSQRNRRKRPLFFEAICDRPLYFEIMGLGRDSVHSPRSGFSRPQDSTSINHCYPTYSDCSSKEGAVTGAVLGTRKFHRGHHWHQTHE
jgi:hypothetical protein